MNNNSYAYVLITPARNEEQYIEKTIRAVIYQTIRPLKWIVVSDGSTDRTDEIIEKYARQYDFIQLLRIAGNKRRDFASKVNAINRGHESLWNVNYEFIGNLDADVTFEDDYYERMLNKFKDNSRLGISGGIIYELVGRHFQKQKISLNSVAGAVQLFRRKCYEDVGGYIPLNYGGEDSAAEIISRMRGWDVQTFPDLKVFHHRRLSLNSGKVITNRFRQGVTCYLLGYSFLFQLLKSFYRITDKPYVLSGMLSFCGFCWASLRRFKRTVPDDVVRYIRNEQMNRLFSVIKRGK